jgi:two-component sensor histidine kinase
LAGFLNDLCADLQQVSPACRVIRDIPHVAVPADLAVPLGLIVNELVTNAFKHGCPEGGGEVQVRLEAPDGKLRLEVSDRGPGVPDGFDAHGKTGSLGMRLISGMVRQLNGTLNISSAGPGARFVIEMPQN